MILYLVLFIKKIEKFLFRYYIHIITQNSRIY